MHAVMSSRQKWQGLPDKVAKVLGTAITAAVESRNGAFPRPSVCIRAQFVFQFQVRVLPALAAVGQNDFDVFESMHRWAALTQMHTLW